jgi:predicted esterase
LTERQAPRTLQQELFTPFGEFTCDSSKRFEAAPDYQFERIEAIGQLLLKVQYRGLVFFPAVAGKAVAGPIVFLCHGQGLGGTPDKFYATAFLYLMRCLASNGMVAISIETETAKVKGNNTPGTRAEALITHLKNVIKEIKLQKGVDLQGQQLVLLGHSQGGEAVAIAADAVRKGLIADFKTVKAVVSLAPRFTPATFTYAPKFAESFLVIHGSHDLDLFDSSGIKLYEFADKTMVYKGLVWILGGTHAGFIDSTLKASSIDSSSNFLTGGDLMTVIGAATQNWLASVYVLEFLRWRLGLQGVPAIMRGFFLPSKQNQPPVPPSTHDVTLQPPLFADSSSKEVRFNDLAVTSGFSAAQGPVDVSKVCTTSVNRDLGYRLRWDLGNDVSPFIRFSLAGQAPMQLLKKSILFNAVRVVDSPDFNVMTDPLFLKVSLGAKGLPPSVAVSIRIPDSLPMTTVTNGQIKNLSKTVMCTINIILGSFPGMTDLFLNNLSSVTISVSSGAKRGDILLATPRISLV